MGATEGDSTVPFGEVAIGLGAGGSFSFTSGEVAGSGFGASSVVECLPVVHGGIARNSSKVKTRGLQHFQPMYMSALPKLTSHKK